MPLKGICWDNWRCHLSRRKIIPQAFPERITTQPEIQIKVPLFTKVLPCRPVQLHFHHHLLTINETPNRHTIGIHPFSFLFFLRSAMPQGWCGLLVNDLDGGLDVSCRYGNILRLWYVHTKTVLNSFPCWPLSFPAWSWSHNDPTMFYIHIEHLVSAVIISPPALL